MIELPKTGDPEVDAFVIILVCLIIALIVGFKISRALSGQIDELKSAVSVVGKDAKEAKHQVKNDHGTNLRDDLDRIRDKLVTIETGLNTSNLAMVDIRDRLDTLQKEQAYQGRKQHEMEETLFRSLDDQSEMKKDIGGLRADNRHVQTRIDRVVDTVALKDKD